MREYGRVGTAFWSDEKITELSDRGKLLALYLLTGPHSNLIGCFRIPGGYISEDLKWPTETVTETLSELLSKGFIERSLETGWTLLPKYLKHNPIENPNIGKAAVKLIEQVPHNLPLFSSLINSLKPYHERFPKQFFDRFENGSPNPLPNPVEGGYPNQEQEQEIEQEQEQHQESRGATLAEPVRERPAWLALIEAMDRAIVDELGPAQARPNPAGSDSVTAMRMHQAGATPDQVYAVALGRCQRGKRPSTLSYLESEIAQLAAAPTAKPAESGSSLGAHLFRDEIMRFGRLKHFLAHNDWLPQWDDRPADRESAQAEHDRLAAKDQGEAA